jgi:hypothetical protein
MNACLVPHCPSLALAELTAVVAADANDWDSVCALAQLILQVQLLQGLLFARYTQPSQGRDGLARAADRARVLLSFIASCGHPRCWPCTWHFHREKLELMTFHLCRACALLGSLECVHGAVDKGISLLEQAAEKVQYLSDIFVSFRICCDVVNFTGCLRRTPGTGIALSC